VGFEASREGWHVNDTLAEWGNDPRMLDITRIRQLGVGQHKRKNDAIDAEAIAHAVESDRIPEAHVLSPERRELRAQLSVRSALVETRGQYITTIRGLAGAVGVLLPTCQPQNFTRRFAEATLDDVTRPSLRGVPRVGSPASQVLLGAPTSLCPRSARFRSARRFHVAVGAAGSPRFLQNPPVHALFPNPGEIATSGHSGPALLVDVPMLPSASPKASALSTLSISGLYRTACTLAVYASQPPSPTSTQHSLPAGGPPWPDGIRTR
jgi:hypothetical protein